MSDTNIRRLVSEWWRTHCQEADKIRVPDMAQDCIADMRNNPEFMMAFIETFLYPVVYDIGMRTVVQQRGVTRSGGVEPEAKLYPVGNQFISQQALRQELATELESEDVAKWGNWKEYDTESRMHIALPSMTKEQVFRAALRRDDMADGAKREAVVLRLIAGKMKDGETVGDAWTIDEVQKIRDEVELTWVIKLNGTKLPAWTGA